MVLAMKAPEVTPCRGNGKGLAPRQEVKKGFFLNGVHIGRDEFFIDQGVEAPLFVLAHTTYSPLSIGDEAAVTAQKAADLPFFLLFIEIRLFHRLPLGVQCYHIHG